MNNPFIGQVTIFAGNFPPRAFAFCQGQLLPIASNTALFSILGTTYGGDGRTTFALPDLRGRCAIHPGRGPGLSTYVLGERQGIETVNLNLLQLPSHSHIAQAARTAGGTANGTIKSGGAGDGNIAEDNYFADPPNVGLNAVNLYTNTATETMSSTAVAINLTSVPPPTVSLNNNGGSQSHENRRPFIAINYIIALQGTYPARS